MPLSDEQIRQARAVSTQAVIVLGRTAGEDQDNADVEGGYRLTADEKHMLHQVCREFDEVAVVLNTAGLSISHGLTIRCCVNAFARFCMSGTVARTAHRPQLRCYTAM